MKNERVMPHHLMYESLFREAIGAPEDISQAKELRTTSSVQDFIKAVGLDPKLFFRIYHTLYEVMFNKDGSLTKFARDYMVKDFDTLYKVLKEVKQKIKNDHLVPAWEVVREMYMVAYPKLLAKGLFDDPVHAVNFTQRTIWYVLDNLKVLQKVFKIMEYMQQNEEFRNIMLSLEKKFGAQIQKNEM